MAEFKKDDQQVTASHRTSRTTSSDTETQNSYGTAKRFALSTKHKTIIALFSLLLTVLSVANPLLANFASPYQSHALYTGHALLEGALPYTHTFATGGILYYLMIAASYMLGSSAWLMLLQGLAYYISGIYFDKLITFTTGRERLGLNFTVIFYLLNLGLGFGGLYPIQFAMALVLLCLWLLATYFTQTVRDERFIYFGFLATLAALIEPKTLLLWLIVLFVIACYNSYHKHFARGFYQILCMIFGSLLVYYSVGYFVFLMGNLWDYIAQALLHNFTHLAIDRYSMTLSLPFQLLVMAAAGLLLGVFGLIAQRHIHHEHRALKWIAALAIMINLPYILLSHSFTLYNLLQVMPFGLILSALEIHEQAEREEEPKKTLKRRRQRQFQENYSRLFFRKHLYLPVLVIFAGILYPIFQGISSTGINQERQVISNYLVDHTESKDKIYVWDTSAKIYLDASIPSTSQFPLPAFNTASRDNNKKMQDELLDDSAEYIVVNTSDKLPVSIKKVIEETYQQTPIKGADHFIVYHKK